MENTFSKVGHRNYALIDETTLTAEELEAVKMARAYDGILGVVPMSYKVESIEKYFIYYGRVHKTMGYTVVLDNEKNVRFIQKGYLTLDEVSSLNKGRNVDEIKSWMLHTIFLIRESMK